MWQTLASKPQALGLALAVGAGLLALLPLELSAQQASPPQQAASGRLDSRDKVQLSFKDVEISELVSAFSTTLGRPFIVDPRVKGKISLEAPEPVTVRQAFDMLASALAIQGFALSEANGMVRIVPATDARSLVPDLYRGPAQAGLVTRTFDLSHQDVTQISAAVRALLPATSPMTVIPKSNTLVVTDSRENMDRVADLVARLDRKQTTEIRSIPIQHAYAPDLAVMVDQLFNAPLAAGGGAQDHHKLTLLPDPRSNRLLIRGADARRVAEAEALVRELDSPLTRPANVHVIYLKNAEAAQLAETLQGLFKTVAGQSAGVRTAGSAGSGGSAPVSPLLGGAGGATAGGLSLGSTGLSASASGGATSSLSGGLSGLGSGSGGSGSGFGGSGNASTAPLQGATGLVKAEAGAVIQADPTQNALLVVAPEPLFQQIRAVVEQLDQRPAQVFIESLIVEISADQSAEFGVQFQYLNGLDETGIRAIGGTNFNARGTGSNLLDLAVNPLAASAGLNIGVIKGTVNFAGTTIANLGLLARALQSSGSGNILATPNLLTLDNQEARIIIGQNVPFITGSFTTTGNAATNPFQTIERQDVGTTLRVKPLISEGGAIRMKIFQEVSSVSQRLAEGIITNKRAIESTVMVNDQQIIVLGGLIQDESTDGESKVPGLGDVPILGNLFRYDSRSRRKTNLYVFLRPVIIRSPSDSHLLSMDRYQSIRAAQQGLPAQRESFVLPSLDRATLPETPSAFGLAVSQQLIPSPSRSSDEASEAK